MDFKTLTTPALSNALSKTGITAPTEVQKKAIPAVKAGKHLLVEAPTGTGKTLAYLLPILEKINPTGTQVEAIILAPTYELAMQIARTGAELTKAAELPIRVQGLIGGANIERQIQKLKEKPQVIVGSAGRILELLRKNKLKLQNVHTLVLDEFDRLLDEQNARHTKDVLHALAQDVQLLLVSATAPQKARTHAQSLGSLEEIVIRTDAKANENIAHYYQMESFRNKIARIKKLANSLPIKKGLVFINKSCNAERTLEKLRFEGLAVAALLGTANKQARKQAIADFEKDKVQLLLATDLAARGIDVADIDYVINLDLPENSTVYLHRAGRTARAGKQGAVITLADYKEEKKLHALEAALHVKFKKLK